MATPRVSIIIPVYNAGTRLDGCLQSVARQTMTDCEVIILLDKPTDGSDERCLHWAQQYLNLRVVSNTENLHIGQSRNRGVDIAQGEYIGFVDHDDWIEPEMYECLYARAQETDADIVISNVRTTLRHDDANVDHLPAQQDAASMQQELLQDLISSGGADRHNSFYASILGNLYRRSFLEQKGLRFVDTRKITPEDLIFNIMAFHAANRIAVVDQIFYHHINHSSNAGSAPAYRDYHLREAAWRVIDEHVRQWPDYNTYQHALRQGMTKQAIAIMAETMVHHPLQVRSVSRYFRESDFYQEAVQEYDLPEHPNLIKRLFRHLVLRAIRR
ncbi:MAG: glycosyltransferase [Paludibacteraceae bacterium]|nr:glycosyltransferase [Paludibacteraceae bacterium]